MVIVIYEMGFVEFVVDRIIFMDEGKICEELKLKEFFINLKIECVKYFLNIF